MSKELDRAPDYSPSSLSEVTCPQFGESNLPTFRDNFGEPTFAGKTAD
jgi:hypothetical protein